MAAITKVTVVVMVAAVVVVMAVTTEGQAPLPPCAQKLIPCVEYLNYTGPLAPCCDGLKEVLANEVPCLCQFVKDHGLLSNSKIGGGDDDPRSPYDLPQQCGVSDTITCDVNNGAVRMIAGTAISSFLLLGALLML